MEIIYPHLLLQRENVDNIIKLILERLAMGDAPFLSKITNDVLHHSVNKISLHSPTHDVINFIKNEYGFMRSPIKWKEVRKYGIRNSLIFSYVSKQNLSECNQKLKLLELHLALSSKKINSDSIELSLQTFQIQNINDSLVSG